jgi:hypothetical protein
MHGEEERNPRSRRRSKNVRLCRHLGNRLRFQELRQGARQGRGGGRTSHIGGDKNAPGDEKTGGSEAKDQGCEEGCQEEADSKKGGSQEETSLIPPQALTSLAFPLPPNSLSDWWLRGSDDAMSSRAMKPQPCVANECRGDHHDRSCGIFRIGLCAHEGLL